MSFSSQDRNRWARILDSKAFLAGESLVLIVLLVAFGNTIVQRYKVRQEIQRLQNDVTKYESSNEELQSLVQFFQSDFFKEREGRLKLGLSKEGESTISIPQNDQNDNTPSTIDAQGRVLSATDENADNENISTPQRWWNYFFKKEKIE